MGDNERLAPTKHESTTLLNLTQRMMERLPVKQFAQRMEGKVEMKAPGEGVKLVKQFKDNLTAILNTASSLTRNESTQIRQIAQTVREQNLSPQQAAQDLKIKLTTTQQEMLTRFSSATQNAVSAGISADETRSFLREAIGTSNMARHLLDLGQTARAQQLLDMYDKGATLDTLHNQMREWGHSSWVNEELTRLAAYESLISGIASQYARSMASRAMIGGAAQLGKTNMQNIAERIRSVDELAKQKLEELKKEEGEEKKLTAGEKRKKLREDAEKMLQEEEEGKKTSRKEPAAAQLEQATNIKSDMRDELYKIEGARKSLLAKMPLDRAFNDPKFEDMFEQHRHEEITDTRKYFQTGMVPVKVLDAIANIRPPDVASYGPVSQLAILRAYRKTLQEYAQASPRAM